MQFFLDKSRSCFLLAFFLFPGFAYAAFSYAAFSYAALSLPFTNTTTEIYECSSASADVQPSAILTTQHYPSNTHCQISTLSAWQKFSNNEALLIDVRPQQEYESVSVPNSLNIAPYLLKRKTFLKGRSLLLINKGDQTIELNLVCQNLRQLGYQVSVVSGGLNAWRHIDSNLNGTADKIRQIDEVTSKVFYQELKHSDIVSVRLLTTDSQEKSAIAQLNSETLHIPPNISINDLKKRLKNELSKNPGKTRIVFFDEQGKSYGKLKSQLNNTLQASLFYLQGGERAFRKYQQHRQDIIKRQKIPPKSTFRCRS